MYKSRTSLNRPIYLGRESFGGSSVNWHYQLLNYKHEELYSTDNPDWVHQADVGGYFNHYLEEWRTSPSNFVNLDLSNIFKYQGTFVVKDFVGFSKPVGDGTFYGATAYAAMKPSKPDYSLNNMIYELKDLGHMLKQSYEFFDLEKLKALRSLGSVSKEVADRFLAQVFGWNPTVNDVYTLIEKQQKLQQRIAWLVRNNGKWVNRKWTNTHSKPTRTVGAWITDYGCMRPLLRTQHYHTVPSYRDIVEIEDKIWATAQFKYFLPEMPPGVDLEFALKRALQGFRLPNAADYYRAIGWTWLIDWCFGLANVFENLDAGIADRIAARRFYIMRQQSYISTRIARARMWLPNGQTTEIESSAANVSRLQTRTRGSAFIPGNPNALSGMQLAILGALGLSRL